MSKEYNPAVGFAKAVGGTILGVGLGVVTTTAALLLAEHLKRLADAGALHAPFTGKLIWLGPRNERLQPVPQPAPAGPPQPTPAPNATAPELRLIHLTEVAL